MAGRWLPDIQSFGAYFPSAIRRAEASKKYQTEEFFENVETKEYLETAEAFYLTKAKEAFPDLERCTPESVTEILHEQLQKSAKALEDIQRAWQSLCHIRARRKAIADDFEAYIIHELSTLKKQQAKLIKIKEAEQKWHEFLGNESVMYSLFSWLPAMKRKRRSHIIRKMNPTLELALHDFHWSEPEQIEPCLRQALNDVKQAIKNHQHHLKQAEEIAAQEKLALSHWHSLDEQLGADRQQELDLRVR